MIVIFPSSLAAKAPWKPSPVRESALMTPHTYPEPRAVVSEREMARTPGTPLYVKTLEGPW
eukprot:CAMPEP_0172080612 /NCGR_PEP_ID=MMETSP1043-20130122/18836_1 /TAXON_ID=464988 /ORGANISM="Hemiselmis andersenii, Strain CCMP441" /LENGTH=60 /DNA_ID=CAMNT_0012741947 /DNA_START=129 /DNA_END=311 /DNA_ORIENTATION=-